MEYEKFLFWYCKRGIPAPRYAYHYLNRFLDFNADMRAVYTVFSQHGSEALLEARDKIGKHVSGTVAHANLAEYDIPDYPQVKVRESGWKAGDLLLQVDMKSANHQVFHKMDTGGFPGTWEELCEQLGVAAYIAKSKRLRQVVYSKIARSYDNLPSKQNTLMSYLTRLLHTTAGVPAPTQLGSDSLTYFANDLTEAKTTRQNLLASSAEINLNVTTKLYRPRLLSRGKKQGYIHDILDDMGNVVSHELHGVPSYLAWGALVQMAGMPLDQRDLAHEVDGTLFYLDKSEVSHVERSAAPCK